MTLKYYDSYLSVITKFRQEEIAFKDIKRSLVSSGIYDIGRKLGYEKNLYKVLDAWFEYIEFCYLEKDWRELALSVCDFIEHAIIDEPNPLKLPKNDRVVKEQGL